LSRRFLKPANLSTFGPIVDIISRFPLRQIENQEAKSNMPSVKVRDNEPFDIAMRRFKRACEKAGVLAEVHRREYYEKPTQVRKRKAAAAVKRWQKKASRQVARRVRLY
tara:strand:+ start:3346 stop:3672 length:327 start_codon:yes stop_codon:yes gene_type:complete